MTIHDASLVDTNKLSNQAEEGLSLQESMTRYEELKRILQELLNDDTVNANQEVNRKLISSFKF